MYFYNVIVDNRFRLKENIFRYFPVFASKKF